MYIFIYHLLKDYTIFTSNVCECFLNELYGYHNLNFTDFLCAFVMEMFLMQNEIKNVPINENEFDSNK